MAKPIHDGLPSIHLNLLKIYRFTVEEIVGKTVIIHSNADDFTTQPSGNSGEKIACGIIKKR